LLDVIKGSEYYNRLVECVANYYTLMELSQDLIQRVKVYRIDLGLGQGDKDKSDGFQENMKRFTANWTVN